MYFSLQYLSYSDAVVLRYIAPILTGFSGAIFLKERLFLKQFVAGCKHFVIELASTAILQDASVQPLWCGSDCQTAVPFWWPAREYVRLCYTTTKDDLCHVRTPPFLSEIFFLIFSCFAAQPWWASSGRAVRVSLVFATVAHACFLIVPTDTVLRAIGKRAHPFHVNALFSSQCVLFSTIGCVSRLSFFASLNSLSSHIPV